MATVSGRYMIYLHEVRINHSEFSIGVFYHAFQRALPQKPLFFQLHKKKGAVRSAT